MEPLALAFLCSVSQAIHRKHYISDLLSPPAPHHHHYMPFMSLRLVCACVSPRVRAFGSSETHKGSTNEHMKREVSFRNDERSLEALGEENVGHTQLHVNWLYLSTPVYFIFVH